MSILSSVAVGEDLGHPSFRLEIDLAMAANIRSSQCSRAVRKQQLPEKRKGDFSCEISPFLSAFVEDLVRLPNHNVVIPKSFVTREPSPRFLHSSNITRYKSFLAAMHRVPVT
jgi:hypothetical protein